MRFRTGLLILLVLIGASSCSRDPEVVKRKYVENGNKYYERGKYKEASIMYRSALKKDLRYGEAYYRLGLTQLKLSDPTGAAAALRRAVELQPENDDAKGKLADLYLTALMADPKKPEFLKKEIKDLATLLLKRNPKSFAGERLQGYLAWLDNDLKGAIAHFQTANAVKPMDPNLILALSQVLAADNRFDEGEKLARALIDQHKDFVAIYQSLYLQYLRQNRIQDAENILKLKMANNPGQIDYALELAHLYYLLQRREEAGRILDGLLSKSREFPNAFEKVGDFHLRFREFEKALSTYQRGVKQGGDNELVLRRKVADSYVAWGKRNEAARLVDDILKDHPKDDVAQAMKASLALDSGNRQQLQSVVNELQASVTRLPKNAVLRFNLGRAHWAKGELDQAITQFKASIELQSDYLAPRLALTQIQLNRRDFVAAQKSVSEILALSPNLVQGRMMRALASQGMGNKEEARRDLDAIAQADPKSKDVQFQLGLLYLNQGAQKEAEALFQKCYQTGSSDVRCLVGLGEIYALQNQYDKALQLLNTALQRTPDRPEIRLALANAAVRAQKYDVAIAAFEKLIAGDPKAANLRIKLGETYRRMGKTDQAIEEFRKAKDLEPGDATVYVPLAILLDTSGRRAEARTLYQQVLKLQPDNAIALNNLAYIIAETGGSMDEALTLAQRAKQILPLDANVADTLGWIYIKKNLSENAVQIYSDLVTKNPGNSTFRYHLAMALFQKGDKPSARKELQTALRSNPSKEEEGKIRELMAKIG